MRGAEESVAGGSVFDDAAANAEIASPRAFVRARASPRVRRRVRRVVFFFFAQEDAGATNTSSGHLSGAAHAASSATGAPAEVPERGLSDAQGVHDREGQFGLALGVYTKLAPGGVVG